MILPRSKDALHRGMLYRLMIDIADTPLLSNSLIFKGGTCAALLGELDRFSVDLDFDLVPETNQKKIRNLLENSFKKLNFMIHDYSANTIQYILKYEAPKEQRNTLQIDAVDTAYRVDRYKPMLLQDIERYLVCQTIETMFAHKLVAITDRYQKHRAIAGRDLYDIHYFFINGRTYHADIIRERTGKNPLAYLKELVAFIQGKITNKIINEDLNMLLSYEQFSAIRKSLKQEVITMLQGEINKLTR